MHVLHAQWLRFRFRLKFRRNGADKPRIKPELEKNRADFADIDRRFVKFEINKIVIAIDLVAQTRDR